MQSLNKISIIGNAGAGKTYLARKLSQIHHLPITHVDAIQFLPNLQMRPYRESIEILKKIQEQPQWIVDGYGPLDILEQRLRLSDQIVMIDFPLWRHYFWATKRQFQNLYSRRKELPEGTSELSFSHIVKLYKTLWKVHKQMRPELLRILARENLKDKVIMIRSLKEFRKLARRGLL
jgi:adenylate kinase family enzyme